jgi:hypothetical protein
VADKRTKRIKRPVSIQVGAHPYRIRWRPMDGLYGQTSPSACVIEVDPSNAPSQVRDTLLHEALHAVVADTRTRLDRDDEEQLVRVLTPGLLALIRNNPHLVAFLLED